MRYMNNLLLFVFLVSWNMCYAWYLPIPPPPPPTARQQRPVLYQAQGYLPNRALSPKGIRDFEYVPTAQGYRFSYILNDGTRNGANVITNDVILPSHLYPDVDAKNTGLNSVGIGGRPKNRKLSPKSLQSLAG